MCDGCNEECESFMEIKSGWMNCSNGLDHNSSMGFEEVKLDERVFCSFPCMYHWFEDETNDLYFPGDQKGFKKVGGIMGK